MAIMGIPQALKMIEGPIDALARLPQQELVAMAQRSPSVLKILPIVLNEKADAAQRAANMAALAQGTPPSVTDQNIAINAQAEAQPMMLPENVGVAALPVPEGSYAGGGIVAFDDGGQVQRFQNTGLVQGPVGFNLPMPSGITNPATLRAYYLSKGLPLPFELMTQDEKARAANSKQLNEPYPAGVFPKIGRFFSNLGTIGENVISGGMGFNYYSQPEAEKTTAQLAAVTKPDAVIPPNATAPAAPAEDKSLVTPEGASVIPGQGLRLPAPPIGSAFDITKDILEGRPNTATGERMDGYFQRSENRERRLMEALGKDRLQGKAFSEYETMLKKEGEQAGLDKNQAKYMALLKAGLSMMAGTSRHALENIGKGALVGVEDYQAAYKDLRKSERERTKEFALIEQARRAEQRDDLNRRDQLLIRASDAAENRDKFGVSALMNAGVKDQDRAVDIWSKQYLGGVQMRGQDISLQTAQERTRALANRGARLTPAQLGRFRENAMKSIDQNAIRAQVAKDIKLSKVPAPGADKNFDKRVNDAYENAINDYIRRVLGGGTSGTTFQGYSLIPPDAE